MTSKVQPRIVTNHVAHHAAAPLAESTMEPRILPQVPQAESWATSFPLSESHRVHANPTPSLFLQKTTTSTTTTTTTASSTAVTPTSPRISKTIFDRGSDHQIIPRPAPSAFPKTSSGSLNLLLHPRARINTAFGTIETRPLRHSAKSSRYLLFLSPRLLLVCWWMVFVFHASDLAFLIATTRLYDWILHDALASYFLFGNLSFDVSSHQLEIMNWFFAIVAAMHSFALVRTLYQSFQVRHLAFATWTSTPVVTLRDRLTSVASRRFSGGHFASSMPTRKKQSRKVQFFYRVKIVWRTGAALLVSGYELVLLNCIEPLFSINGKYFDDVFLFQKCIEVVLQVYQSNQMSSLIATRWINNVVVFMIFLNCISTPVIHRIVPNSNAPLRRLVAVVMSSLLSFVNSVVVPMLIFEPYVRAYDPMTHFFQQQFLFDDVWYAKSVRENQQLFVTSNIDFLSTLWPHCSLLNCLRICESMLDRDSGPISESITVIPVRYAGSIPTLSRFTRLRRSVTSSADRISSTLSWYTSKPPALRAALRFLCFNFLWLLGIIILGIHIAAQSVPEVAGCKLNSTPWFVGGKSSCVIMNVNCYRRGIEGNQTEVEDILNLFNINTLFILSFTHCPALGMPSVIRSFHALNGIDIYNSTVADWPAEASVNEQDFPLLSYVYFVRSNMTSVPQGLLHDALPPSLLEIYLYGTNVSSLPEVVKEKWATLPILCLEFSQFEAIPTVLAEMQVQFLFLTGNPVHGMTQHNDLFANGSLIQFQASRTPFATFPNASSDSLGSTLWLYLEYTAVDQVPEYIQQWYLDSSRAGKAIEHSLYGSPYCNKSIGVVEEGDEHPVESQEREYQQQVCAEDHGSSAGFYPIEVVVPQRAL